MAVPCIEVCKLSCCHVFSLQGITHILKQHISYNFKKNLVEVWKPTHIDGTFELAHTCVKILLYPDKKIKRR